MQRVYAILKESQELQIKEEQRRKTSGEFGKKMEAMRIMVHALCYDVDLEEYPRLAYGGYDTKVDTTRE
jgi:ribonuclease PH